MSAPAQMVIPHADQLGPQLEVIAVHPHAGRLYRCTGCGRILWSAYGRARQHAVDCYQRPRRADERPA